MSCHVVAHPPYIEVTVFWPATATTISIVAGSDDTLNYRPAGGKPTQLPYEFEELTIVAIHHYNKSPSITSICIVRKDCLVRAAIRSYPVHVLLMEAPGETPCKSKMLNV